MGAADSKLAFKKCVFRLFEERNIPSCDNDYWEQFWTLPECADDVFLLVGAQDIRRVRDNAQENLKCLIGKVLARLFWLCNSRDFLKEDAPAIQVLNCIRILARLFPFIFESEDMADWEEHYFWRSADTAMSDTHQMYSHHLSSSSAPKQEERTGPTYGQLLIKSLVDLLFTSGFTLPTALETRTRVSYVIWETGIGASNPIGTSKELDDNRTEVLRLLLILFSKSMYLSPANIATTENHWINTVATGLDRQRTIAVLCSLINSALKYNPSGWGLPYNHVMFSDERELLAMLCLQTIVALLDYRVIEKPLGDPCNIFCHYLSRLHREQDFLFLTDGMYRILSNPMVASSTYLPGSTKQAKCHHETLMLCWKALEINKRFRDYLYQTNRVLDIVIILLYFSLENKQEASQIGLLQMCAHMLQTLSKDKTFGNCLNKAFDRHASLPANVRIRRFHGTYGDYLICSVYSLITTTKHSLRSLYSALISTIANVSPYLRNLSLLSTSRLLQLTTSFASSSYLLAEEANHEFLGIFLDAICSILYYQAPYNPHLIYTLVQYEPKIQTMAGFTLQRGLRDINK
ncbi:high-temperature-induced dauer-formation protein-domain-containing protein, partial [Lobosporangium transversale]